MTPNDSTSVTITDAVANLQELTLRAALLGETLPGMDRPIQFPDLPFIMQRKPVVLLNENLGPHSSFARLSVPIRVLAKNSLLEQAAREGDTAYLHFQPPRIQQNTIHLSLEAGIVSPDPNVKQLGLSGMRIGFRRTNDHWAVFYGPVYYAS